MKKLLQLIFLCFRYGLTLAASDTLVVKDNTVKLISNNYFKQIDDPGKKLSYRDVKAIKNFTGSVTELPGLKVSNPVIWLKVIIKNISTEANIPVTIGNTIIDSFDIYYTDKKTGADIHLEPERYEPTYFSPKETVINCNISPGTAQTIYIRVQSISPTIIPIEVYSESKYWDNYSSRNSGFAIFIGIMLVMMLYNLFLYFIVKDKSYLYYVSYVGFLTVSQALLHGYRIYLINDSTLLNNYIVPFIRILLWLSINLFVAEFLQLKKLYPLIYKRYLVLYAIWLIPFVITLAGYINIAYNTITWLSTVSSLLLLIIGIKLYYDGVRQAKFFMLAWSMFLISVLISVGRNKGYFPYNSFTSNILLYGAVFELVLFSIALADKINFYRDQNNESQFLALKIAKENEKLITEQNIQLENKVLDRTKELLESNTNLQGLITNLRSAQSQLIETEKMASLGQLTAGIAHEINNPINFVRSNIKPLRLDFTDIFDLLDKYAALEKQDVNGVLKETIEYKKKIDLDFIRKEVTDLLNGIEEGASRTAEIVQSLRAFSRTDEVELKPADINKSVLNSLVLLRNIIPYYIEITPVFDKIDPINCYPGKLNQVFMNVIHNSIQAIMEKKKHHKESILIRTKDYPENVSIEITDTGIGMTSEVKQKMFDPFYTTKDVGEGTGLGLSIVFGIIEKHKGAIDVKSKPGKGTTIIIMIPKTLS